MALSGQLIERFCEHLSQHLGVPVDVEGERTVGGGSINDAYRLNTNEGPFFAKVNHAGRFPSMFEAEADGLRRLRAAASLRVPEVIATGEDHEDGYILMEWIEAGRKGEVFWSSFGRGLAELHQHTQERFGLDRDNYIGSLVQYNATAADWVSFFIQQRMEPMLRMARDHRHLGAATMFRFERLFGKLHELFPVEAPALLHGDLWSGNFLCDADGRAVLIDPAVYYGHREMDIAMTRLFGGFDPALVDAYNDAWPMEAGWEERIDLCNLYPLLVHVNLFGGGYGAQVEAVLRRFT